MSTKPNGCGALASRRYARRRRIRCTFSAMLTIWKYVENARMKSRAVLGASDAEQQLQLAVGRLIAFAVRDRELARGLDEIEQRLAALLAHELADELAEPMHVLAQRAILLREEDVRADRAGGG